MTTGATPPPSTAARKRAEAMRTHRTAFIVMTVLLVAAPAVVYPVEGLVDATLRDKTGLVTRDETPESVR